MSSKNCRSRRPGTSDDEEASATVLRRPTQSFIGIEVSGDESEGDRADFCSMERSSDQGMGCGLTMLWTL